MSLEAQQWAWDLDDVRDGDFRLLLALADSSNGQGMVMLAQERLAKMCKCDERTIRRRLNSLRTQQLVKRMPSYRVDGKGRGVDMLVLMMPGWPEVVDDIVGMEMPHVSDGEHTGQIVHKPDDEPTKGNDRAKKANRTNRAADIVVVTYFGSTKEDVGTSIQRPSVDKLKVNNEEWSAAETIIAAFNEAFETKFTLVGSRGSRPTEHLKRIVCRLRENPEVTLDEHKEMIKRNAELPPIGHWWGAGKPTTVGVLYGDRSFLRCLSPERPTSKQSFADERPTDPDDNPW